MVNMLKEIEKLENMSNRLEENTNRSEKEPNRGP